MGWSCFFLGIECVKDINRCAYQTPKNVKCQSGSPLSALGSVYPTPERPCCPPRGPSLYIGHPLCCNSFSYWLLFVLLPPDELLRIL